MRINGNGEVMQNELDKNNRQLTGQRRTRIGLLAELGDLHQSHVCEYFRKGDIVSDEVLPVGDSPNGKTA